MEASQQPTTDELQKAGEVSAAAATAVAGADSKEQARERADEAIKSKASEVKLTLSEQDRHQIVDELIERMDSLGAFQPPPAAAAPAPPPAAGEQPPPAPVETPAVPEKRTFAERFAGI